MDNQSKVTNVSVLTDEKLAELRAIVKAAAAREAPGADYIGTMIWAAPKLLAEVERLNKINQLAWDACGKACTERDALEERVKQLEATLRLARDHLDMQRNEQAYDVLHRALKGVP